MKFLTAVIERDSQGYFAYCPDLQGCYTQGEDFAEVLENLKDAIRLHIEDRIAEGEKILGARAVRLTGVQVQHGRMEIGLELIVEA